MSPELPIIIPDWPVPDYVRSFTTTRVGGVSSGAFKTFNLAKHVGDDATSVAQNRAILKRDWLLPAEPHWLNQTHSTRVLELTDKTFDTDADAAWTEQIDTVCAVLTADCLPLLLYHPGMHRVAAIHAGWRGLLEGIIENTIESMTDSPETLFVWLGPAIGPAQFEVGVEVKDAFKAHDKNSVSCFTKGQSEGKYLADIYALARQRLGKYGITTIYGGEYCTVSDEKRFYSYRRDSYSSGKDTGRMASLIWLSE